MTSLSHIHNVCLVKPVPCRHWMFAFLAAWKKELYGTLLLCWTLLHSALCRAAVHSAFCFFVNIVTFQVCFICLCVLWMLWSMCIGSLITYAYSSSRFAWSPKDLFLFSLLRFSCSLCVGYPGCHLLKDGCPLSFRIVLRYTFCHPCPWCFLPFAKSFGQTVEFGCAGSWSLCLHQYWNGTVTTTPEQKKTTCHWMSECLTTHDNQKRNRKVIFNCFAKMSITDNRS